MHERRYTPARANPQSLEHLRIFLQQELDKIAQALMFEFPEVTVQMSITSDGSGLKLDGDVASPGNNKVYGTDGSGVRGWYAAGSGGGLSQAQVLALGLGA